MALVVYYERVGVVDDPASYKPVGLGFGLRVIHINAQSTGFALFERHSSVQGLCSVQVPSNQILTQGLYDSSCYCPNPKYLTTC